ncbi:uncharacterized protein K452DRAFT_288441, partial [Aplosporella prunicola CBS 121167]
MTAWGFGLNATLGRSSAASADRPSHALQPDSLRAAAPYRDIFYSLRRLTLAAPRSPANDKAAGSASSLWDRALIVRLNHHHHHSTNHC